MSSKFARRLKVQKPPAVCKKSPPPLDIPWPSSFDRPPQGMVSHDDYIYSGTIHFAAEFTFDTPYTPTIWRKILPSDPFEFHVYLYQYPSTGLDRFRIFVYDSGFLVQMRTTPYGIPRSRVPYDSGLRFAQYTTIPRSVRFRAMA